MLKNNTLKEEYPPGDFAIWIIIYLELITFGLLFIGYVVSRRENVQLFNDSQLMVSQTTGFINTLILITSSYFVVKAVHGIKNMTKESSKESSIKHQNGFCLLLYSGLLF